MRPWPNAVALLAAIPAACNRSAPNPTAPPAAAAPSARSGPNAADTYFAAWARMDPELEQLAGSVAFTPQGASIVQGTEGVTWEQVVAKLQSHQPAITELIKAAALERCDFGLPDIKRRSEPERMQPLLAFVGRLRATGRLLRADAARAWTDGDTEGAVERVAALYGLLAHTSREPLLIVAMTNSALLELANDTTRQLTDGAAGHSLTELQRAKLLAAIDRLDHQDPAGLVRARKAESAVADQPVAAQLNAAQTRILRDMAETRRKLGRE